jgi:hypothetical protein
MRIKTIFMLTALVAVAASGAFAQSGMQFGVNFGPTWAMGGRIEDVDLGVDRSFKDAFDTGYSFGAYAAGPISGYFGWRGEFGYDNLPADGDAFNGVEFDYKMWRFAGGIQLGEFGSEAKGMPYGFVTLGLVNQNATVSDGDVDLDFDGGTDFGLNFGGGYNYKIGTNWGIGGDIRVNAGFFDDDTRWWWTPSGQVFFSW